jgi:hypothetical protein
MFTYKNILITIVSIIISTNCFSTNLRNINEDSPAPSRIVDVPAIEGVPYSIRHMKSDIAYGSCIAAGCAVGSFVSLFPYLRAELMLAGWEGLRLFFYAFGWQIGTGMVAGAAVGCCVGAAWKAKIISGCTCGSHEGASAVIIHPSSPEENV